MAAVRGSASRAQSPLLHLGSGLSKFPHVVECTHSPGEEGQRWIFTNLDKSEAREAYGVLKGKELEWKERRRREHLEHDKAMGARFIDSRDPHAGGLDLRPWGAGLPTSPSRTWRRDGRRDNAKMHRVWMGSERNR